ncbi:MAG TPA: hypothetical protein VI670_04550 [Thermoanaerobaculia bacterium]
MTRSARVGLSHNVHGGVPASCAATSRCAASRHSTKSARGVAVALLYGPMMPPHRRSRAKVENVHCSCGRNTARATTGTS